jgi:hypothetical protein
LEDRWIAHRFPQERESRNQLALLVRGTSGVPNSSSHAKSPAQRGKADRGDGVHGSFRSIPLRLRSNKVHSELAADLAGCFKERFVLANSPEFHNIFSVASLRGRKISNAATKTYRRKKLPHAHRTGGFPVMLLHKKLDEIRGGNILQGDAELLNRTQSVKINTNSSANHT